MKRIALIVVFLLVLSIPIQASSNMKVVGSKILNPLEAFINQLLETLTIFGLAVPETINLEDAKTTDYDTGLDFAFHVPCPANPTHIHWRMIDIDRNYEVEQGYEPLAEWDLGCSNEIEFYMVLYNFPEYFFRSDVMTSDLKRYKAIGRITERFDDGVAITHKCVSIRPDNGQCEYDEIIFDVVKTTPTTTVGPTTTIGPTTTTTIQQCIGEGQEYSEALGYPCCEGLKKCLSGFCEKTCPTDETTTTTIGPTSTTTIPVQDGEDWLEENQDLIFYAIVIILIAWAWRYMKK